MIGPLREFHNNSDSNGGIEAPSRDYSIPGTKVSKIFTTAPECFQRYRSLVNYYSNPSIWRTCRLFFYYFVFYFSIFWQNASPCNQATVRQPVVKNMLKALYFQFTVGLLPMYAVTFMGYWAYGSKTSTYLLNSMSGPVWVKALANLTAFLQTVIALHIFASPMYEYLDTKYDIRGSALAVRNLAFRIAVRGGYMGITTFIAALLPFLGDFMSLTGAFSTFPLTFILANHMYLIAKKDKLTSLQKSWHWFNVGFFGLPSCCSRNCCFEAYCSRLEHIPCFRRFINIVKVY